MSKVSISYGLQVILAFLLFYTGKAQETPGSGQSYASPAPAPASAASKSGGGSSGKKPWAISVSVREEYDDNINTVKHNKSASFKTIVSPSFLLDYPLGDTILSARYSFGATYFYDRKGDNLDLSHEFLFRANHSFSSRFNVDVRDSIGYRQDPQLGSGVGLTRRNGDYLSNSFSIQGDLEWTPKLSTVTAYTNDYSHYLDRLVNRTQERMVHELSHDFRFHLLPSTTLVFGGIYRYQDYFLIQRDSQSVTLNGGADYQVTPQFTLGGRAGATYTDFIGGGSDISPYGSVNANWTLGARSSVQFGYHHSISGTDVSNAFVQESDAIDFGGRYAITNKLTARAQVSYTIGQYDNKTLLSGNKFTENLMAGNLGLAYAYNKYLDFELGYIYTRVDSDVSNRGYDRNQFYIGVRGTY